MLKQSLPQNFPKFICLKTKKYTPAKERLHTFWILLQSNFSQLFINYCGPYLQDTIALSQNTDLEQSTTLKIFLKKLKAYLFTLDNGTFLFDIVLCRR